MSVYIVTILACLSLGQTATERSLARRFDSIVRSMMPEWVLQPVDPLYQPTPNEEFFRWRKQPAEPGPGMIVTVNTYDTPGTAEAKLQEALRFLPIGGIEIHGVGDHAIHVRMQGRSEAPGWMGTMYATVGARLLIVSGDKDSADVRALAAALAAELQKTKRDVPLPTRHSPAESRSSVRDPGSF